MEEEESRFNYFSRHKATIEEFRENGGIVFINVSINIRLINISLEIDYYLYEHDTVTCGTDNRKPYWHQATMVGILGIPMNRRVNETLFSYNEVVCHDKSCSKLKCQIILHF